MRLSAACDATSGRWGSEGHWVAVLPLCPAGGEGSVQAGRSGAFVPLQMEAGQAAVFRGHVETRLVPSEKGTRWFVVVVAENRAVWKHDEARDAPKARPGDAVQLSEALPVAVIEAGLQEVHDGERGRWQSVLQAG